MSGRYNVSFEDVRRVFLPAMRHRVILNFEAEAEGIDPDKVLLEILQKVPEKAEDTQGGVTANASCNCVQMRMLMTMQTMTPNDGHASPGHPTRRNQIVRISSFISNVASH